MFHESALSIGESPDQDARSLGVEIDAHDISRFEWRIIIPLPAHKVLKYTIEAQFELPSTSVSGRSPREQLQGFTRLDDPQTVAGDANEEGSVNLIRQKVLALQHMLRLAREGVHRHCRLVSETRPPELEAATGNLLTWLNTAFRAVAKARTREAASQAEDTEEIGRERKLADEFISMRFIAFIADSQAMVDGMLGVPAASDGRFRPTLALK